MSEAISYYRVTLHIGNAPPNPHLIQSVSAVRVFVTGVLLNQHIPVDRIEIEPVRAKS